MAVTRYARFTFYLAIICISGIIVLHLKLSTFYHRDYHFGVTGRNDHGETGHLKIIAMDTNSTTPETCALTSAQYNHPPLTEPIPDWDLSRYVNGPPTKRFRDNLLEDEFYITGMASGGFTTQFIIYVNMIYLGIISRRVPVVPAFTPHYHISLAAGAIPFGHVFNLSRARNELKQPLLEWMDVKYRPSSTSIKPPSSSEREQLGCWSTLNEGNQLLRTATMEDYLQLDISYTRVPAEVRHDRNAKDKHLVFGHLVPYIFPGSSLSSLVQQYPLLESSPLGHSLPPDEQLACFDLLYSMTSSSQAFEWRFLWSPAWNVVGTHLHFTDDLVRLAKGYLGNAFSKAVNDLPPFIAIHMRRKEFDSQCEADKECFIPLGTFRRMLTSMKEEIYFRDGTKIRHILLTSDEDNVAFWKAAKNLGWVNLDHIGAKTAEKYGEWYPAIIDIIAQSMAIGFIGTQDSTLSLVNSRRVQDWNDGPALLVSRADRTNLDFISEDF
ncbi:hypothetical protein BDN70DRAFT_723912 [Pholiota conissans]|uniref:O-fucosyltransferase family protein n=1 Tax=Pholiota conissans TaxID=109636 RepID=A0A9P5Z290_9AGAR|nr:hypothetical protein BDN70DRAFT_723912 [Pholiota conissans]